MPNFFTGWVDEQNKITLLRRDEFGIKSVRIPAKYSFFVTGLDNDDRYALGRDKRVMSVNFDGKYTRVDCGTFWTRKDILKILESAIEETGKDIEILEADVQPIRRLFSDNGNLDIDDELKICFIDIETDSRCSFDEIKAGKGRVLSWAICDYVGDDMQAAVLENDTDEAELKLFKLMFDEFSKYDCICAWNGWGFDFPVIQNRIEKIKFKYKGLSFIKERWNWLDHMEVYKHNNKMASGDEKTSYALDHVAKIVLGDDEGKLKFDSSKTWEAWVKDGEYRKELLVYNIQDTALLPRIEAKSEFLSLHLQTCKICRIFPDEFSLRATTQGDGFMLRLGEELGYRWKTKPYVEDGKREKFKGAYVMEPKILGSVENVHVADFSSLYPSIMRTFNMSLETKVTRNNLYSHEEISEGIKPKLLDNLCQLPNRATWFRTDKEGMFKIALDRLVAKRKEYASMMKQQVPGSAEHEKYKRLSQAFKVVANSFYGIVGSVYSRFFDVEVAEGVTQTGKWLIETVIEECNNTGKLIPFYADTDSAFVSGNPDEFKALVNEINESWSDRLAEYGVKKHYVDLDFEKSFSRIIMTGKKRYAAKYTMYKGSVAPDDAPPEVKGLEFNRGDSVRLAREFQKQIIYKLLEPELPDLPIIMDIVNDWKRRTYEDEFELDDIIISQSLKKAMEEYNLKSAPPHVRMAMKMVENNEVVQTGMKIRYIAIKSNDTKLTPAEPTLENLKIIDRQFYWEKRVFPPIQRILECVYPEKTFKTSNFEKKQIALEEKGQLTIFDRFDAPKEPEKEYVEVNLTGRRLEITLVDKSALLNGSDYPRQQRFMEALKSIINANVGDYSVYLICKYYLEKDKAKCVIDINRRIARNEKVSKLLNRILDSESSFKFFD